MFGFSQAQSDYEASLTSPYDRGGALFDEEEYIKEKEDLRDDLGNLAYDEWKVENL